MMMKKVFAAVFAAVGILTAAVAIYIGMNFTDKAPTLLTPPTVARSRVVAVMDAVSDGNYDEASKSILGNPSLGVDRDATDEVGVLIWEAFQDSIRFELVGECYSTEDGLAQDVTFTSLDIKSVTANLKERSQNLLKKRVDEAEDTSDIYDENNEYREDFVMEVLLDAAKQALKEDSQEKTVNLTVKLSYHEGNWWVVADTALLDAISGGILY